MEYIFIVNPKARSGMGEMTWRKLEPELKKKKVTYQVYLTHRAGHACDIAGQVTADNEEHTLVVLGGDGTVNEVLNGIRDVGKVTLGYIPLGSSNDFARGMGIPKEPAEALAVILNKGRICSMDVGVTTRNGKQKRFAVSTGIGFDAAVCHEVCVSKWKAFLNMLHLGKLSYAAVAFDRLIKDKAVNARITLDTGETRTFEKTWFVAAMNHRYEGGGFCFCPKASAEDGMLDVIVASGVSKLKILCLLPTAFAGWHVHFKGVTILRCREAEISLDAPLPIHTDGEPLFLRRKMTVGLLPDKIRIITA